MFKLIRVACGLNDFFFLIETKCAGTCQMHIASFFLSLFSHKNV